MEIKKIDVSTQDMYYDLFDGGYIDPDELCKNKEDAKKVREAIGVIKDFLNSCENTIEDFIR